MRGILATHSSGKSRIKHARVQRFHFHRKWLKTHEFGTWLVENRTDVWCRACYPKRLSSTGKGLFFTTKVNKSGKNKIFSADMLRLHRDSPKHKKNMMVLLGDKAFKGTDKRRKLPMQTLQATSVLLRLFRIVYKMGQLMQPFHQYPIEVATHIVNATCTHAPDSTNPKAMCGSGMQCRTCAAQLSLGQVCILLVQFM